MSHGTCCVCVVVLFFKRMTAYEMRISDWSSDVCSSDLVLVEILNADGSMARRPQLEVFAREHGLKIGSIEDLIRHRLETEHTVERVDEREIDTEHGAFRLHTYRDRLSHTLHFALLRGAPDPATPPLVRVHVHNRLANGLHWRRAAFGPPLGERSEERRVGREWVRACRYRGL